ncbi:MAG: hypothetical protein GY717_05985 [Rhodobacteraceae bacterium]|nr:hypothetical protein [Paracoccaceae bacterium]
MKAFLIAISILLVPAIAFAQGKDPFGYEFDDYLCHDIPKSDWIKPHYRLQMKDQFGHTDSEALRAVFICNPVAKEVLVDGKVVNEDGINNPELHYMCYTFDPGRTDAENKRFAVENEFEQNKYKTGGPRMVCVPSLKRH